MKNLNEKTTLITGAASGMGKALTLEFAKIGSELVLLDIDKPALKELKDHVTKNYNHVPTIIHCDLSDAKDRDKIPKKILARTDILVNNAGIGSQGFFINRPYNEFAHIIAVNYLAPVHLSKMLLVERGLESQTTIVNMASLVGLIETPLMSAYSSSKFAVAAFSGCLGMELYGTNVHVMTVYPGPAYTPFGKMFGTVRKYDKFYHKFIILKPEAVARSIIKGIKRNKQRVIIPPYLRLLALFRNLCPTLYGNIIARIQRKRSKEFS